MLFKDIAGHTAIKTQITKAVRENRISHAQLFLGNEGSGNLALAIAYAQYINCFDKKDDDSCGICNSCLKYKKLIHPDLHFVYPVATTKSVKNPVSDEFIKEWREIISANPYINLTSWYEHIGMENKQGNIGKDESQSIIKKLSLKTFEAEYKVMIIWMAEKMNAACANKLLKILEEPPDKTLFILVAESTEQVLTTILSRTQLLKLPKIAKEDLLIKLQQDYNKPGLNLEKIAHLANGNFHKAIKIINSDEKDNENHERFINLMRLAYKKDVLNINSWIDEIATIGREGLKTFFEYALRMVRENYMLNIKMDQITYLDDEEESFSKNFHIFITDNNINSIVDEFTKAHIHIEHNAYNKIVLLDMSLKLFALINPRKNA